MEGTPSLLDEIRDREFSLDLDEEELSASKKKLQEAATTEGRTLAKEILQGFDSGFSDTGYDSRDARLIFHPVSHVVFVGRSRKEVVEIVLLANKPKDGTTEDMQNSIRKLSKKATLILKRCVLMVRAQSRLNRNI
jgi:predicted Holliday junction resolvase-like endonuclease